MQDMSIEGFRISPQQKCLWLLQQAGNSQAYRAQCAVIIEGNLNIETLETAIRRVVDRHEILRTNFQALPGMNIPLQVITNHYIKSVYCHDLSSLSTEEQQAKIEAIFHTASLIPFDFECGSVLEVSLVVLSPVKHVLLVSLPAMNADAFSLKNFVLEISRAYEASLHNQKLSDEPLQYVDIAEWQNELFEGEDAEIGREYWRKKDISGIANWQLPYENQPEELGFAPKFITLNFPDEIVAKLEAIAQEYKTSTSVFLQSCWQILLGRLTGKSDVVVGTYCNGRNYEELETALGLLAKYLPVACHLEDKFKFSDILKQTSESVSEAYKWQETFTWEQITESNANTFGSSFFPFCFEFQSQPTKYCAADVSFSIYKQYVCIDQFKVKLSCVQCNDSLITEFHYDANLYLEEDIWRLAGQFQTLIASVINTPEAAISELEILSASDRQQILFQFNQTQTHYPKDLCIHQLFEQQAACTPENIAVVFENQQLTYAQLNAHANQLARHLQTEGVGPETIVALCVERSLDMIIGLLGILKAGGAYLPLDPLLPKQRLAFMLQDAGASVILTQRYLTERLFEQAAPTICLDTDWDVIAQQLDENPLSAATPDNLVYVVYTSGSTGKPKGVAVEHQQLLNYLHGILERLDLPSGCSYATVSTFAADLGNTAIFPALSTGGCLHVISQERATNPEALADYCDRHPIDCLKIVPSHLNALLAASQPEKILPRQRLILGGEATSWNLVEKLRQYKPSCQIFNHYGPTETTVGVLTYAIATEPIRNKTATVPIGRAIANTQIYILDHHLRPVPMGVPGEIYIGGDSLARGYLNQPQLTSERFIQNPKLSARLYKTGDLARYLPDGNIDFLGRIDDQVKIHGFRIEVGEIESVLSQHPGIWETVVLAREDEPGNKRLVAYIVPHQPEFSVSDLRSFLKEKLPEYMIPYAFVQLKELPLTPNGKLDRSGLPAPESIKPELEGRFVAPRTPIEETIAKIWTEVLGLRVGIYDNFFELGGDSILSIQIVARANQAGLQLTPKQLFEYPTVAGLATVAGTASTIQAKQGVVTGAIPLTPIQHWFFEQQLCEPHHWNQALLLEVRGTIAPDILKQAVQYLLTHHDALRLRFTPTETGWQQVNTGLDAAEAVPFLYIDLSGIPAAEQETAFEVTATQLQASLNLIDGPLLRVALFDLGENQPNRLLIVIHHLAVDGISWRILLEDLQRLYQQLSQQEAVQLPPKTISFQQWSELLQEYADSEQLLQERDYWLGKSCHSISHLPVDNPGGANTVASAHSVSVSLSVEETNALLKEAPAVYRTEINDLLLTALVQTFTQWTQEPYLLVDLEGHGREALTQGIDLSRTVGWFTTIFPVQLFQSLIGVHTEQPPTTDTISHISQPGEAIKAIKEQLRSIPNRGIGYGVLRYLSADKSVAAQLQTLPQAEVRFNYLGQFDRVLPESSLFQLVKQFPDTSRSPRSTRRYLLDINGLVLGGQLQLEWTYSEQIHQRSTIARLAQAYIEALRSLITHCQSPEAGGYTPSDFQKAKLSQKDLNHLLTQINQSSEKKSK